MPWGNKDQVSSNFVSHLNMRHKFDYDTYVVSLRIKIKRLVFKFKNRTTNKTMSNHYEQPLKHR